MSLQPHAGWKNLKNAELERRINRQFECLSRAPNDASYDRIMKQIEQTQAILDAKRQAYKEARERGRLKREQAARG